MSESRGVTAALGSSRSRRAWVARSRPARH